MADARLLQALEYILNYSDEQSIEVLAEAVVRRRRDLSVFNVMGGIRDPQEMAKELTESINSGIGSLESIRNSVREMAVRIIKENAPELSASQIDGLSEAWIPEPESEKKVPKDMLLSMIEQFVSFSQGTMSKSVDKNLRDGIGDWPERYWNVFPSVIRQLITDFLKDKISEEDFNSRVGIALG